MLFCAYENHSVGHSRQIKKDVTSHKRCKDKREKVYQQQTRTNEFVHKHTLTQAGTHKYTHVRVYTILKEHIYIHAHTRMCTQILTRKPA